MRWNEGSGSERRNHLLEFVVGPWQGNTVRVVWDPSIVYAGLLEVWVEMCKGGLGFGGVQ